MKIDLTYTSEIVRDFERVMSRITQTTASARANLEAFRRFAQEAGEPLNRWESEGGAL